MANGIIHSFTLGLLLSSRMAYAGDSAERTALECLGVLHDWGYQKLRLCTAIAPSGFNFRYMIALASHFEANGMYFDYKYADEALLTSSRGFSPPFDWPEAVDMDPQTLADLFLMRCPELAAAGVGADPAYAKWYKEMLEINRPTGLIVFYSDTFTALTHGIEVMNLNRDVKVPLGTAPGITSSS